MERGWCKGKAHNSSESDEEMESNDGHKIRREKSNFGQSPQKSSSSKRHQSRDSSSTSNSDGDHRPEKNNKDKKNSVGGKKEKSDKKSSTEKDQKKRRQRSYDPGLERVQRQREYSSETSTNSNDLSLPKKTKVKAKIPKNQLVVYSIMDKDLSTFREILKYPIIQKLSDLTPTNPKHSQVYLFRRKEAGNNYWRDDRRRWKCIRTKTAKSQDHGKEKVLRQTQFRLYSEKLPIDFYRYEYEYDGNSRHVLVHFSGTDGLWKHAIISPHGNQLPSGHHAGDRIRRALNLEASPGKTPVKKYRTNEPQTPETTKIPETDVLIDIEISENEIEEVNPKQRHRPYFQTDPSVLTNLENSLRNNKKPAGVYRDATIKTFGVENPSLAPRNVRQVYNLSSKIKRSEGTRDDLYEMFCLSRENPEYVPNFRISNSLNIVVAHPTMNAHINNLMEIQNKSKQHLVFHYDTTFGMGDFFVSLLSVRHPFLETEPVLIVATMMHEFSDELAHTDFFKSMIEKIPLLATQCAIIVTDREKSIRNAITKQLPDAHLVFCWNHLRKNVGDWAQKKFGLERSNQYRQDIFSLLSAESVEVYEETLNELRLGWDIQFSNYFDTNISPDLAVTARWIVEPLEIFNPNSGITNNPAESANASIKSVLKTPGGFYQVAMTTYFLQVYNLMEVKRGFDGVGNWILKKGESNNIKSLDTIGPFQDVIDETIIESVTVHGKVPDNIKVPPAGVQKVPSTNLGIAKILVAKNRIEMALNTGTFVVRGLMGKVHNVNLGQRTCTCNRPDTCVHLLAVLLKTGMYNQFETAKRQTRRSLGRVYRATKYRKSGKKGSGRVRYPVAPLSQASGKRTREASTELSSQSNDFAASPLNKRKRKATQSDLPPKKYESLRVKDFSLLPLLKFPNQNKVIVDHPKLTLADLKSIAKTLQKKECDVLNKMNNGTNYTTEDGGWLHDRVIDGFLCNTINSQTSVALPTAVIETFLKGADKHTSFPMQTYNSKKIDWMSSDLDHIAIPVNLGNYHWVLIFLWKKTREFAYLDPSNPAKINEIMVTRMTSAIDNLDKSGSNKNWSQRKAEFRKQSKSGDCGVLVLAFATSLHKGESINFNLDTDDFRCRILGELIGNCTALNVMRTHNICLVCEKKALPREAILCVRCKQRNHKTCLPDQSLEYVCSALD